MYRESQPNLTKTISTMALIKKKKKSNIFYSSDGNILAKWTKYLTLKMGLCRKINIFISSVYVWLACLSIFPCSGV